MTKKVQDYKVILNNFARFINKDDNIADLASHNYDDLVNNFIKICKIAQDLKKLGVNKIEIKGL